jgi:hypothetical protein
LLRLLNLLLLITCMLKQPAYAFIDITVRCRKRALRTLTAESHGYKAVAAAATATANAALGEEAHIKTMRFQTPQLQRHNTRQTQHGAFESRFVALLNVFIGVANSAFIRER